MTAQMPHRFPLPIEVTKALESVPSAPVKKTESTDERNALLLDTLSKVYVPSTSAINCAAAIFRELAVYERQTYSSLHSYAAAVQDSSKWVFKPTPVFCVTGFAGVGKSALFARLLLILSASSPSEVSTDGLTVKLRPSHFTDTRNRLSMSTILSCILGEKVRYSHASPEALEQVRHRLKSECSLLHIVDELQFLTLSSSANASMASMLLTLHQLAVPTAFATNFSGLRKLLKRPQEDRDRLLRQIYQLDPFRPGDSQWIRLLSCLQDILSERLDFQLQDLEEDVWELTYGLGRPLMELLKQAVLSGRTIRRTDLLNIFQSDQFANWRGDLRALRSGSISPADQRRLESKGLWSPVRSPEPVDRQVALVESLEPPLQELTKPERAALLKLKNGIDHATKLATGKATPSKRSLAAQDAMFNAMRLAGINPPDPG